MNGTAGEDARITLLRAGSGQGRSPSALSQAVRRGVLRRLRPGVFVEAAEWESVWLSDRHRSFTAAVGLSAPSAVFCGETALALYEAPLLSWPRVVHYRTPFRSKAGHHSTPFFPLHARTPLKPADMSRAEAQKRVSSGALPIPCLKLPVPGVVFEDGEQAVVSVEPLPYVLIDTLPGLAPQEAVVVLDAVMAGRYGFGRPVAGGVLDAAEVLLTGKRAAQWRSLRDFADSRSESPGESRSRVLIHQLGFAAPELQREVALPGGRRARLNFDWEHDGVCGEFDGRVKYQGVADGKMVDGASVYWEEKWREDEIEEHTGRRFVRWQWADLDEPRRLERRLLLKGVSRR